MKPRRRYYRIAIPVAILLLCSCVHRLTMHSRDGERLDGRWRFAREGSALMQVFSSDGEILVGLLKPVARHTFFKSYRQAFGENAIDAGPDLSSYGNALVSLPGSPNVLGDVVLGENFDIAAGGPAQIVSGPLFYWTANLQGDKRNVMDCYLIGSSQSGRGLGRCKGGTGKEYTVQF